MMGRPPRTEQQFIDNFWARVNKAGPIPAHKPELGPCWIWTGKVDKDGYGRLHWGHSWWRSNRVSWKLKHGAIPEGIHILHHCDNPPCVNDSHLFSGTPKDNSQDALAKGRNYIGNKNPFFGKHHTEVTRSKIRIGHLGKPLSPEHAQKARVACLGKRRSPEQILHYKAAARKRWADGGKEAFNL